jgi:LuxR family transcriptional regulator, maltose regulon positive regulatory protein
MSQSAIPLLATKLHVVRPQPDIIVRERLSQRAEELIRRRLILVSAPAGFGKTTLVSSWIEEHSFPTAWLSLDRADNDVVRFLRYLVASLRTVNGELGAGIESALSMSPRPEIDTLLTSLVNELAAIEEHFLLVLDDFHTIDSDAVTSAVLFLLEHGPEQLHVVITTRSDPSFPLSRLRVRGQLLEVRAADLRFTDTETRSLFNDSLELGLSDRQIAALEAKTEGWIAGLQMAALSVQGRSDVDTFISAFAGTDRYVLDYLVEEVLNRQSPDLKHAMLQLSILDSFNTALVEAVTGIGNGAELIDVLERGNLFVVSLDDRREWFRYHTLFADLLAHHHSRLYPEEVATLHRRASAWYESAGRIDRAVEHARNAGDIDLIVRLIEDHCLTLLNNRQYPHLSELDLVRAIPEERLLVSPRLAIVLVGMLEPPSNGARMLQLIAAVDDSAATIEDDGTRFEILANARFYTACVELYSGRLREAIEQCERSLEQLELANVNRRSNSVDRQSILSYQGLALSRLGEWDRAERVWEEVLHLSRRSGNTTLAVSMLHNLALWEMSRARLTACWSRCEEILRLKETVDTSMNVRNTFQVDVAHAHQKMASVLYDRNDLEGAHRLIHTAIGLYPSGLSFELTPTLKTAIHIESALGNVDAAFGLLEQWEKLPLPAHGAAYGMAGRTVRALLELQTGNIEAVERWVEAFYGPDSHKLPQRTFLMTVFEETTYARFLLRVGRPAEALARMEPLQSQLAERTLIRTLLDTLVLGALALKALGRDDEAFDTIARALTIAAPERIVRAFLIDGIDAVRLVRSWRKQATAFDPLVGRLVDLVETAFDPSSARITTLEIGVGAGAGLMEPLTNREIEILNLMAAGYSNQKIAGKLYLSVNTIKTHASNLFSKLGASSRMEAISRAREERIL